MHAKNINVEKFEKMLEKKKGKLDLTLKKKLLYASLNLFLFIFLFFKEFKIFKFISNFQYFFFILGKLKRVRDFAFLISFFSSTYNKKFKNDSCSPITIKLHSINVKPSLEFKVPYMWWVILIREKWILILI